MSQTPLFSQKNLLIGALFVSISILSGSLISSVVLITRMSTSPQDLLTGVNPQLETLQAAIDLLATVVPEI